MTFWLKANIKNDIYAVLRNLLHLGRYFDNRNI